MSFLLIIPVLYSIYEPILEEDEVLADDTGFVLKGKNNPDYYYTKSKVDPLYLQAEGHAVITQWYQMKNRIVEIVS